MLNRTANKYQLCYMYRMYLDEHGVDKMSRLHLEIFLYLSLTGVVMEINKARDYLVPALNRIKAEVFKEDPDTPICFHRTKIRQSKGVRRHIKWNIRAV